MKFAVFDLDHTLLPVDSGENWSRWLVRSAGMDVAQMDARIEAYAEAYRKGAFSADEFMAFQAGLLASCRRSDLEKWREAYIDACVRPHLLPEAIWLVEARRKAGFGPVLASGTHAFVTGAIAPLFGIRHLVAAQPEEDAGGEFTGRIAGSHSYGTGKLTLLKTFLEAQGAKDGDLALEAYSDSINDLPMLEFAAEHGRAFAVNPDGMLRSEAARRGWPIMNIFKKDRA